MTKQHTRIFFYAGTLLFSLIFIGMTIHTHTQFGELTNADQLTPQVVEGQHVWHDNNCINCHTLMGEGAYYAPDLTEITEQRGATYLRAFLQDPSRFYSEQTHRRIMPNPELTDREIDAVIAFLDWVSKIDNQDWPPRPIRVTGAIQGAYGGAAQAEPASDDPVELGQALFNGSTGCVACHSTNPGVLLAGPSLAGIGARAQETVEAPGYEGAATTPEEYIRESIVDPNAYLVDQERFGAGGVSLMPANYEQTLTDKQIDDIVAFLATLR